MNTSSEILCLRDPWLKRFFAHENDFERVFKVYSMIPQQKMICRLGVLGGIVSNNGTQFARANVQAQC